MKQWTCIIPLTLAALLLACSPNPAATPSSGPAPANTPTTSASTSATPVPLPSAAPTAKVSPTPFGQALTFPDARGLDRLDSYSLVLRVSFKGMRDGQSVETSDVYTRTFSREPSAQFTTIQTTTAEGKPLRMLSGSIGPALYTQAGADRPCTVRWSDVVTSTVAFNPAQLLTPARSGKELGRETVNGVPARHYMLGAGSFDRRGNADVSGDLWIAETGNFVVKYAVRVAGDETYFGKGVRGEQTTAFEVTDIGAKKSLAPPAGCPAPYVDLPAMPDAAKVVRTPWGQSYSTASGMDKTVAFYKDQMKTRGWVLEPGSGGSSGRYFLMFSLAQEKKHAYVKLTVDGAAVQVDAQVQPD